VIRPARLAEIRAIVERKAIEHPELRRPLGLAGFRRILGRERIKLVLTHHPRVAQLVASPNGWAIVIDRRQSPDGRLVCGCHELAHLWLHHDPYFARHETTIYDASPPWYDTLREEEADVFAELLVRGPEKGISDIKKSSRRPRRATQLELADPDGEAFLARVKHAPREAPSAPDPSPLVQFAIRRDVWSSVDLLAVRRQAGQWTYRDNLGDSPGANDFQFVTCSERVGLAIVEQLARAGHKRSAARVRRTIRQTRQTRGAPFDGIHK